ncbi:hypothetical protein M1105_08005 [Limibaculum sp. FT325]|uniref:hypothetical protein n=1 Tax=Thermohalobaculum sediminis TaxID=2939436 RepID=UPI0020C15FBA|nr:hypothetical protein [Limibaculum sediminis]MCL5776926.1 hypothetical protein [Limibaculum sediminis]
MTMNNGAATAAEKSQKESALALDDESAIARLRTSRVRYRQNLEIDAKKSGAKWLMAYATYEQIMFLSAVRAGKHDGDAMQLDNAVALFNEIDRQIPRVSEVASWSRDETWLEAFINGALERWNEVSDKIEAG